MCRLICALVVRIRHKTGFLMTSLESDRKDRPRHHTFPILACTVLFKHIYSFYNQQKILTVGKTTRSHHICGIRKYHKMSEFHTGTRLAGTLSVLNAGCTCVFTDEDLTGPWMVFALFNSISVMSRQWKGDHRQWKGDCDQVTVMGCEMKLRSGLSRILSWVGFEPATQWSVAGSCNHSAMQTFLYVDRQMSRLMTKPTKWHLCPAKTQITLGIHPVWSESLHPPCLIWVSRLIWVFAGHTVILLVLSWGSSNTNHKKKQQTLHIGWKMSLWPLLWQLIGIKRTLKY